MTTPNTQKEISHAEQNAKCGYESIVEMVANLDRETAIEKWIEDLSDERIRELCEAAEISDQASYRPKLMRELREDLRCAMSDESFDAPGFEWNEEDAQQTIEDDPLSIEVRSGWYSPGADPEDREAEEFCILLSTGGPALRIRGELSGGEPSRAWLEYQDWGTPWTQYFDTEQDTLLAYCRQFYFAD